jgi:WD40 repeat protein
VTIVQRDFSPDGKRIARPEGKGVQIRDAETGNPVMALAGGHEAMVLVAHFSDDGNRVVSGDKDGKIAVWDSQTGRKTMVLEGHGDAIRQLAVRKGIPDLASGSDDGMIKLWDLAAGKETRTLTGHQKAVYFVGFSPDGNRLVSASKDRTARIWDVESGKEVSILKGHDKPVRSAQFNPQGTVLATGAGDGTIKLWDLGTGQEKRTLEGAGGPVVEIHWSKDGVWVLAYQFVKSALTRQTVSVVGLWNAESGEHVVSDYAQEARLAPVDWPYRAVLEEVKRRSRHLSP